MFHLGCDGVSIMGRPYTHQDKYSTIAYLWKLLYGTTPEKRRYNAATLILFVLVLIMLLGIVIKCFLLVGIVAVLTIFFLPIYISMKIDYGRKFEKNLWRLITGRKSHEKEESE